MNETYKCEICHFQYKLRRSLEKHIRTKHPELSEEEQQQLLSLNNDFEQNNPNTYPCQKCDSTYGSKRSLYNHVRVKHPLKRNDPEFPVASFKCNHCDKDFTWKKSLLKHHKKKHFQLSSPDIISPLKKFICNHCQFEFSEKTYLKFHIEKLHSKHFEKSMHMLIFCAICDYSCNSFDRLLDHYMTEHHIELKRELLTFKTKEEFMKWKEEEEKRSRNRYIQHTSIQKNKNGGESVSYYCHRSGFYRPKGVRKRRLKKQGSKKIGRNCPSKMYVRFLANGDVLVKYVPTHIGHEPELSHLPLTQGQKMDLAKRISETASYENILSDIRNSVDFQAISKLDLLTKKDLYNIENYCKDTSTILQNSNRLELIFIQESQDMANPLIGTDKSPMLNYVSLENIESKQTNSFLESKQCYIKELVEFIQDNINTPEQLMIAKNVTRGFKNKKPPPIITTIETVSSIPEDIQIEISTIESKNNLLLEEEASFCYLDL